jgi:hypothetical protein
MTTSQEVAQWRHGRCMTQIPAIKLASGDLSFDHGEMSDALGVHFFAREWEPIPHSLPGDPPPLPNRPFPPLVKEEVEAMLKKMVNKTSPGESGFGCK